MKLHSRKHGSLAAAAVIAAVLGLAMLGAHRAEALLQNAGTCGESPTAGLPYIISPVSVAPLGPGAGLFECDITTSASGAGNTVVTVTGGAVFNGGLAGTLSVCAVFSGMNTATLTLTCPAVAAGQAGLGMTGNASVSITGMTLNQPSGITLFGGFPYQFDTSDIATPVTNVGEAAPNGTSVCTNTSRPGLPILVGDTFSCAITFPAGQTPSFVVPTFTGTGGATFTGTTTTAGRAGSPSGYYCGTGSTNTPCTTATITGTATAPGTIAFTIDAYALGAPSSYSTASPVTATGPGGFGILPAPPAGPVPPNAPLTGTTAALAICGSAAAAAVAVTSGFECDFLTQAQINAGDPAGLVITAPPGTTITDAFLNPPGPATACTRTNGGASFTFGGCANNIPAGTVVQVYLTGTAVNPALTISGTNNTPPVPFGPIPTNFQFDGGTAIEFANSTENATPTSITCSNTSNPGGPLFIGQNFTCTVTYAGNTPSFITVGPGPGGSGTFTLTNATVPSGRAGVPNGYRCPAGALTPASVCTTFTFTGTANTGGPFAFQLTNFALGAAVPYGAFAASGASAPAIVGPAIGGAFIFAAGGTPTVSAIGCVNTNDQTLIQFPTQPGLVGGAVISSSNQNNTVNGAGVAVTPGSLSVIAPTNAGNGFGAFFAAVTCGAAFQDNDADPNLIDGGTITFNLPNPLGFAQGGLGQILESNGNSFTVQCGSAVAFLETCQGANTVISGSQTSCPPPQGPTCVAEPTASNTVHVGLRPNVSFSLIGGFAPVITISATYNRFLSYGPAFSLTTNSFVIGLTAPVYNLSLTPTPNTIPAALGSTTGSVITASLSRVVVAACAPLAAFGAFTICPVPGAVLALGLAVQTLTPGAEPGVVTFQTTSGVFGNPATVNAGSQQVASVHCGAAAGTAPVILTPQVGQLFQFSLTSCTSVSVTLFGGGAAGTAVVTATYVADYTGSTATAATTVTLSATAPTVTLTRGCNEVITGPTVAAAATSAIILALVSPSSAVVSIWQFNNSLHAFQAFYFSTAGAPLDINSVGPNQSLFICVSGTATFTTS